LAEQDDEDGDHRQGGGDFRHGCNPRFCGTM
jgi:hypothetical protein